MKPMFQAIALLLFLCKGQSCSIGEQYRQYFKIKSCFRSDNQVIAKSTFRDVKGCMGFVREKNGFAFNYSPPEMNMEYFNCEVLACPEGGNLTTLVNDTKFDYYSSYANLNENSTCLRGIGIFQLVLEKENYTASILKCQEYGGDLSNILTEARTEQLSFLIKANVKAWYKVAYVGLDDISTEGKFFTSSREPLSCYEFRAWSPGHPRNKHRREDCVILDEDKMWKVVNCKKKLPFLCELYPEGPGRSNNTFNINCGTMIDKDARRNCREEKRKIHLHQPDIDTERCSGNI